VWGLSVPSSFGRKTPQACYCANMTDDVLREEFCAFVVTAAAS
jgi:hypothetical protein